MTTTTTTKKTTKRAQADRFAREMEARLVAAQNELAAALSDAVVATARLCARAIETAPPMDVAEALKVLGVLGAFLPHDEIRAMTKALLEKERRT